MSDKIEKVKIEVNIPESEIKLKRCLYPRTLGVSIASLVVLVSLTVGVIFVDTVSYIGLIAYLIFVVALITLCGLAYKADNSKAMFYIEQQRADAALRRRVIEDAIKREINLQEKQLKAAIEAKSEANNK